MEAGIERTSSAKPRTLPCESETEVDTEWDEERITRSQEVITDSQSGVPKNSEEDPEHHRLKRGNTLAEPGVLERERLGGNEKQVSQELDIPFGGPLVEADRSGGALPEVCRLQDEQDAKPSQVTPSDLVKTKGSQRRCPRKDDMNGLLGDNFDSPGSQESISTTDRTIDQLKGFLEQYEPKIWQIDARNICKICKKNNVKIKQIK
jgi:hypothetical protein